MAILHRNPMPMSGALFVTNPRGGAVRRRSNGIALRNNGIALRNPLFRRNATQGTLFGTGDMPSGGTISTTTGTKTKTKTKSKTGGTVAQKLTIKQKVDKQPKYVQEYIDKNKKGRLSHDQLDDLIKKAKASRKKDTTKKTTTKKTTTKKTTSGGRKKESLVSLREQAKALGLVGYSNAKRRKLQAMIREPEKYKSRSHKGTRKAGNWDKVKSALKGSGLKMSEIRKLAGDVKRGDKNLGDLRKLAKAIDVYSKAQYDVGRTRRQHAIYGDKGIQSMMGMDEYKSLFNPYKKVQVRKNPVLGVNLLATPLSWVQNAQDYVGRLPVVRHVSFVVTPLALGAVSYTAHMFAEPLVNKGLQFIADQDLPLVSAGAEYAMKAPYTTTGIVAGLALGGLASYNIVDKKSAGLVAGALASVGIVMDLFTKPVVDAVEETIQQAPVEAVAIEAEMAGVHMGAVHQNPVHMGVMHGVAELGYGDASPADAYDCNCIMHPEEIHCAKAGKQAWLEKFGHSPKALRAVSGLKSRHAGRHGHRFGWCIKMIGFENFQKIASLPPKKRAIVLSQLKQQAIATVPQLIKAQQQEYGSLESASIPVAGTFNGACGSDGVGYGAMMFAGQGY